MKPILLASQSNSGSSWFASCIAEANPHLKYFRKEFFNPILNHKHYAPLAQKMGCELYGCVGNLALDLTQEDVDRLVEETWDREDYTFTKENYLVWNLTRFAKHFQVIGLVRAMEFCFPPERISVMHWYENWFYSLTANHRIAPGALEFVMRHATTPHLRAVIGWIVVHLRLRHALHLLNAPVFDYACLVKDGCEELGSRFTPMPEGICLNALAARIVASRRPIPDVSNQRRQEWDGAFKLGEEFMGKFAQAQLEFLQP